MITGDPLLPTTAELAYVLQESDIKVLVLNGNNDVTVYVLPFHWCFPYEIPSARWNSSDTHLTGLPPGK